MSERVNLVHLPPVVDDQAVAEAERILEAGLRRGMLRRVESRVSGEADPSGGDATAKGHEG